jgi:hypothetical protein
MALINATGSKKRERVELRKMTPLDVAVIFSILLFTTGGFFKGEAGLFRATESDAKVAVFQDGILKTTFNLSEDKELAMSGGKMIIEVKDGRVRVKESECPRHVCVRTGWIRHPGETIICVPYATLIEIKSSGKPLVDAVVY